LAAYAKGNKTLSTYDLKDSPLIKNYITLFDGIFIICIGMKNEEIRRYLRI